MHLSANNEKTLVYIISLLIVGILILNFTHFIKRDVQVEASQNKTIKNYSLLENISSIPTKKENFYDIELLAKNYILLDTKSSSILSQKNSDDPVPIASTTKIMTAIIAIENYNLNEQVTISQEAASQIGSIAGLVENEKITVKNLLYCLMLKSGNDSAFALAEHMGFDNFVNKMNAKADYLGLKSTNYKDPAGLNDEGRSTARDLAIEAAYAIKYPIFREIVSTKSTQVTSIDDKYVHILDNSNRLISPEELFYHPNAFGIKTGYTPDAGHCLVSSFKIKDRYLVAVVLNTYEDTADASAKESKKIIDWALENYNF